MNEELTADQRTVLRLCCEAALQREVPYWECWISPKDVLSRYTTRENRRETDVALVLQSLINQGYFVLAPADRPEAADVSNSLPASCQITGLGFEKYAEITFEPYLDLVEAVGALVTSSNMVSHAAIAEHLGVDADVIAHILRYHDLV